MAKPTKPKDRKKGVKGKKAREKAKLDRYWGEEPSDAGNSTLRRGKSRLLSTDPSTTTRRARQQNDQGAITARAPRHHGERMQEDDDEESSLTGPATNTEAYTRLMGMIRSRVAPVVADDDDDDDDDLGHRNTDSMLDDDEEDDEDNDESKSTIDVADPFAQRFSRAPLESQSELDQVMNKLRETTKLRLPAHVDPHLDISVSSSILERLPIINDNNHRRRWPVLSRSFFAYNRESLKRQWDRIHLKRRFDHLQSVIYPLLSIYADMLITSETRESRESTQALAALHILNHVMTSQGRILRHDRKIKDMSNQVDSKEEALLDSDAMRDQGFTRPTVLVLLPTRGCCFNFVQQLVALTGSDSSAIDKIDRFTEEYGPPTSALEDQEKKDERRAEVLKSKGMDWIELFGDEANDDDYFKIGLAVGSTRISKAKANKSNGQAENTCLRLYTDFFRSDIILASPLGLKMTASEESGSDYLSSIEVCLLLRADVMLMQNWDHVNDVLSRLNKNPRSTQYTDFSRVRPYMLVGQAPYWRQLILCSSISDALLQSSFKRFAKSVDGFVRICRRTPIEDASITQVLMPLPQVFERVPCKSFGSQGEDKQAFFLDKVLAKVIRDRQKHTMIFIPSYFDFVSLRNAMLKREVEFVSVTEYSRTSEVTRGRARFLQGLKPIMLYTGRCHFFLRHAIKGVRNLIFFGLPEFASFYAEQINLLESGLTADVNDDGSTRSCLTLFTKYDAHALERVVGSKNCSRMLKGEKDTFVLISKRLN